MKKETAPIKSLLELAQWCKTISLIIFIGFCIFIIVWFIPQSYHTEGFNTITDLQRYGSTIDEFIKMNNNNFNFPSYEGYYQENFSPSMARTLGSKLTWPLYTLHLRRPPYFSASFFKTLLDNVTTYRKMRGWYGDFIQKIEVKEKTKIVVFGPVQGAYHGLVRYFKKLRELGIIGEDLTIQHPDYYLIFLGNVVNRSPYTLEIFSILLELLKKNPENVIYLKGSQEYKENWKIHTLARELIYKAKNLSSSPIPLQDEVDEFFNTLPLTLYCTIPFIKDTKLNYFKCAAFIDNEEYLQLIDAPRYATFLKQKSHERLATFDINHGSDNDPEAAHITPLAIVRDIKKKDCFEKMDGLHLLPPTKGLPTWCVLSTTSASYRDPQSLNFPYDAFVIIKPATQLKDWDITLYNRNVFDKDQAFKTKNFKFFLP